MAIKPLPTDQSAYVGTDGKPATVFYTWLKSLADALNGLLALFPGGSTSSTAWTAYTPTVTAGTGTITASTASGRYYQIGKAVSVQAQVNITTAGTGAGDLIVTLPVASNTSFNYSLAGFEDDTPSTLTVRIEAGDGRIRALNGTGGGGAIASSVNYIFSGTYEAA